MRNVLIAEDEVLVRMGLQVSVPWEKYGLAVAGEASNGMQALELYQQKKPDILITDLIMPGMDGLELIRKIRATGRPCAVIVITCMDRFELLKEAMDLGVVAYLVKATMFVQDIEKALIKANNYLGVPAETGVSCLDAQKVRDTLLHDYVLGGELSPAEFAQRAQRCGLALSGSYWMLGVSYNGPVEISWQLQRILRSMLAERLERLHVAHILHKNSFIASLFVQQPDAGELAMVMGDLRGYMQENFSINLAAVICAKPVPVEALPGLASAMRTRPVPMNQAAAITQVEADGAPVRLNEEGLLRQLRVLIWQAGDYAFACRTMERVDRLEEALRLDAASFRMQAVSLLLLLANQARDRQAAAAEPEESWTPERTLTSILHYAEAQLPRCRAEIGQIVAAIVEHPEIDLPLHESAAMASIHPQYLSNLFKKEIGVGYSEFINIVRIQEAKRLLKNKAWSIQQVAERCGFSEAPYFNRRFKAVTGMTPGEWRRIKR